MYKSIIFLVFISIQAFGQVPKGKLFIIGGGSRPDAMITRIIKESGLDKGGYAVVLPMSSSTPDSSAIWASEPFIKQGITSIKGVYFSQPSELTKGKIDSVRGAKLIYITGGDQNRFMGIVGGTEMVRAIQDAYMNGAVISGTSAGAAVMSKVMITGNQLKQKEYSSTFPTIESGNLETANGLALLPNVLVDQHFVVRSRHNRLITGVIEFPEMTGIGIDESTAILITAGKQVEVVGESQVLVLTNPTRSSANVNSKLAAKDLKLSIYLPGEKFTIGK